ncbi:hypothetical protein EZS27_032389 [termite gut metagenome]|uniref:Uncharacterized protein n=1 Tax=termite gut metagenome TaxID=433724 RepID=A0A5J4Q8W1_9ZZZZ
MTYRVVKVLLATLVVLYNRTSDLSFKKKVTFVLRKDKRILCNATTNV